MMKSFAPFWGKKMTQPHFFKQAKMEKFYRHWAHRKGLETLKVKHASLYGKNPTPAQRKRMAAEVSNYIEECYDYEAEFKTKDIKVTDHVPVEPRRVTLKAEEDEEFFEYEQSIEAYNAEPAKKQLAGTNQNRYERGSLMQRIIDPFDGAPRDEEGAIVYRVTEDEMARFKPGNNEETLKKLYELRKSKSYEPWDVDEEDEEAFRLGLVAELEDNKSPFDIEEFHAVLNKELGVFGSAEKYSVAKDLKEAYQESLSKTKEQRIFETIPAHYFWDIKRPQQDTGFFRENRYNQYRGREYENFFEMRDAEEYFNRQKKKTNVADSVSLHRRY